MKFNGLPKNIVPIVSTGFCIWIIVRHTVRMTFKCSLSFVKIGSLTQILLSFQVFENGGQVLKVEVGN